jgi:photosystem II stability/assembly factor-like uncharacterized protein
MLEKVSLPDVKFADFESVSAAIRFLSPLDGLVAVNLKEEFTPSIYLFITKDGGKTWKVEKLENARGAIFISHDRQYMTTAYSGKVSIYKYKGK